MASNASEPNASEPNASGPISPPVIGITTYLERTSYTSWSEDAAVLPRSYVDTVVRAGGVPVLLPPAGTEFAELVSRMDGLVLAGGADIEPDRYAQPAHAETTGTRPDRDRFEFGLLNAALGTGLPVLAICRGLQVLNVALGGTLHQHLPDQVGHAGHRPELGVFGTCRVNLSAGSRAADLLGPHTTVHCHHHQALDQVADGLTVVGRAEDDTVEAVEAAGPGFVVGVQWHPEHNAEDDRLVSALISAAIDYRGRR